MSSGFGTGMISFGCTSSYSGRWWLGVRPCDSAVIGLALPWSKNKKQRGLIKEAMASELFSMQMYKVRSGDAPEREIRVKSVRLGSVCPSSFFLQCQPRRL